MSVLKFSPSIVNKVPPLILPEFGVTLLMLNLYSKVLNLPLHCTASLASLISFFYLGYYPKFFFKILNLYVDYLPPDNMHTIDVSVTDQTDNS